MSVPQYDTVRLILGDQLNAGHDWFQKTEPNVVYVLAELRSETDYVRHHVQKVCAFFAAMASFAGQLKAGGHRVVHLTLDDTADYKSLGEVVADACRRYGAGRFEYMRPDEYRLREKLLEISLPDVEVYEADTQHFLVPFEELTDRFKQGKAHRMEAFYRRMRRQLDILMDAGEPEGGRWNFDAENRKRLTDDDLAEIPEPLVFANDASAILDRLEAHGVQTIGQPAKELAWPIDREQSLAMLDHFCRICLPRFGRFQDAMTARSPHGWSLYHARLSFSLNAKLLSPLEVIETAVAHYRVNDDISVAQIEGFVRQILGWREFVRGIYWANMPDYTASNYLASEQDLPAYFWSGETAMACMHHAISQSLDFAYAHHIQRLMITGNFALLAGIEPGQVDQWYLGIYIDAIEWVEAPNTRGMSQFADGGLIASKPYAASGSYVNRMSDYCRGCAYDVRSRSTDDACPFNSLYWHFLVRHREKFSANPRMAMPYRTWDRLAKDEQEATMARAEDCLAQIDSL